VTPARILADAAARTLLGAITEGVIAAGVAADLARRIAGDAAERGVPPDDLLEISSLGARR
jgi:hypothetical protein